jgi:adenylate cyclase
MCFNFACALNARLGDGDGALEILEPIFANVAEAFLVHIKADSDLDSLRDDPRFQAMLAAAEARLAAKPDGPAEA